YLEPKAVANPADGPDSARNQLAAPKGNRRGEEWLARLLFYSHPCRGRPGSGGPRMPSYFLAKSEPEPDAFERLVKQKKTAWDGVRNFEARNNLRAMKKGDLVLFYHSGEDKSVVGIAKVLREAYADPTAKEGEWSAVDLGPVKAFTEPVTLARMKAD